MNHFSCLCSVNSSILLLQALTAPCIKIPLGNTKPLTQFVLNRHMIPTNAIHILIQVFFTVPLLREEHIVAVGRFNNELIDCFTFWLPIPKFIYLL